MIYIQLFVSKKVDGFSVGEDSENIMCLRRVLHQAGSVVLVSALLLGPYQPVVAQQMIPPDIPTPNPLPDGIEAITDDWERQDNPVIFGDRIAWTDYRHNSLGDVYVYDLQNPLENGERITVNERNSTKQAWLALNDNHIVWTEGNLHPQGSVQSYSIYAHNFADGSETLIAGNIGSATARVGRLALANDILVLEFDGDIYRYDFAAIDPALTPIIANDGEQDHPDIFEDKIVYYHSEYASPANGIHLYDISTGQDTLIVPSPTDSAERPQISGEVVAWIERQSGQPDDLHWKNISTGESQIIEGTNQIFDLSGQSLVYIAERDGRNDVYHLDLATRTETRVTPDEMQGQHWPGVYDNKVVWRGIRSWSDPSVDNPDIFMRSLTEQTPDLLKTYAPVLHIFSDDFRPTVVEGMVDNSALWDSKFLNELIADPATIPLISNVDRLETDFLDLHNAEPGNLSADEKNALVNAFSSYPTVVYGRYTEDVATKNNTDQLSGLTPTTTYPILQYWFFYPYNNFIYQPFTKPGEEQKPPQKGNHHEGDWEMIQLILDPNTKQPIHLTTSWHWGGTPYNWNDDRLTITGETHPHIFVGRGGHASWGEGDVQFFMVNKIKRGDITPQLNDPNATLFHATNTQCNAARCQVYELRAMPDGERLEGEQNDWNSFPGTWGVKNTELFGKSGPDSPRYIAYGSRLQLENNPINRWLNPIDWANRPNPSGWDIYAASPVNLSLIDSQGNRVSQTEDGSIETNIPGIYYYQPSEGDEPEWATIFTDDEITVRIEGTDTGTMNLSILSFGPDEETIETEFEDVPVTPEFKGEILPDHGGPGTVLQVDENGDGEIDHIYQGEGFLTLKLAYAALPDHAFRRRPHKIRRFLERQAGRVERRIERGQYKKALRELRKLNLRTRVLIKNHDPKDGESSKRIVLEMIRDLRSELRGLRKR